MGIIALFTLMTACSTDDNALSSADCGNVICAPGNLFLQFLDSETGEDVFFNGTYDVDALTIIDLNTNEPFEFLTGSAAEFETTQVALNPFFESREAVSLRLSVDQGFETDLSFDVVFVEGVCCIGNEYSNVVFTGVDSIENTQGVAFYRVFL